MKLKKKNVKFLGFLGFLGFMGFDYFASNNVGSLFMFSFFAYFSYFILHKLLAEAPDERFIENSVKARLKIIPIPMLALLIIGFCSQFPFANKEFIVLVSAIGWISTILAYAVFLYYYEKN